MPSIQAKVKTAFNHAFTFYKQNGRSIESQESCIQQITQMTGFDRATCIEIQAPVLSILMYNDTMDIANQVIQQHLNTVTGIIRGRLLDINHSNVQSISQSLVPALKHLTPDEWSLGMHTTSLSGRKSKDTDGISNQAKGCFGYIKHNGSVSIDKLRLLTLRDSDLTEIDMVYFSNEMAPYSARFNYLDFSYNRINDSGISCLVKHAFVPTGTYAKHVVSLNLSNNNLGDDSAQIISNALVGGQLPATRSIDVSGNNITEVGQKCFSMALKSEAVNFIAITFESHAGRDAVVDFLKKGSSYYFKEFVKRFKNNIDTQYIKTDEDSAFMHCKEGVPKAVVGVTLGIAKCTNPIAKIINSLPQPGEKVPFVTKAVNKLGLFACVMSEEGDNIVTPDLVGCGVELGEYFNGE